MKLLFLFDLIVFWAWVLDHFYVSSLLFLSFSLLLELNRSIVEFWIIFYSICEIHLFLVLISCLMLFLLYISFFSVVSRWFMRKCQYRFHNLSWTFFFHKFFKKIFHQWKNKKKNVLFMSAFAVNTHHIKNWKKKNENTLCTCECLHFVHKQLHTPTKRCSSPFLTRPYIYNIWTKWQLNSPITINKRQPFLTRLSILYSLQELNTFLDFR